MPRIDDEGPGHGGPMPPLRHVQDRLSRDRAVPVRPGEALRHLLPAGPHGPLSRPRRGADPRHGGVGSSRPIPARSAASATRSATSSRACSRPRSCGRSRTMSRTIGGRRARSSGRPRTTACGGSARSSAGTGRPTTPPSSGPTPTTPSRSPARRCRAMSSSPARGTRSRPSSGWPTSLGLPFAIRGNGGSVFGFVFSDGIVLDMGRMRRIEFDLENWCAAVEPGVTSFELQQEAYRRGLRVNAAEPAATVCGNLVCTGTFSTWSNVYGTAADNFIDMEFVGRDGGVFRLNDQAGPEPFRLRAPGPALPRHLHEGLGQAPPDDRRRGRAARPLRGLRRGRPLRPRARAEADRPGPGRPRRPLHRDLPDPRRRAGRPGQGRAAGSPGDQLRRLHDRRRVSAGTPSARWPRTSSMPPCFGC